MNKYKKFSYIQLPSTKAVSFASENIYVIVQPWLFLSLHSMSAFLDCVFFPVGSEVLVMGSAERKNT